MTKKTIIYITIIITFILTLVVYRNIKIKQIQRDRIDNIIMSGFGFKNIEAYRNYEKSYDLYRDASYLKKNKEGGRPNFRHSKEEQKELLIKAREYVEKSIEIEPDVLNSIEHFASLLEDQKEYKKALKYYKKAYELGMKEVFFRRRIINIFYSIGDKQSYKRELYRYVDLVRSSKDYADFEYLFVQLMWVDKPSNLSLIKEFFKLGKQIPDLKDQVIMRKVKEFLEMKKI